MNAGEGLTHPEDLIKEQKMAKALLSGEMRSYNLEKRFRHNNGEYYWYNATVAKMLSPSDDEAFLVGFIEDISNRKKLEQERENLINDMQNALAEIKELRGFLPICANCKKIRDDKGYWQQVENYIQERTHAQFSHGICPECMKELYPEMADKILKKNPK
jgi:DNA repair exonuclease SbcCD ATPase subunit